jgi:CheY-like chemotaxis protein
MKNVIVIDDSLTIHKIVEYSIDPEKFRLHKFFTIEDASGKLKNISPDIVLLDNKLEGLNIKNFCKELKKEIPDVKVILLLGAFEKLNPQDLVKFYADDCINKPFNSKGLSDKIEFLLSGGFSNPTTDDTASEDVEREVDEFTKTLKEMDYEKLLENIGPVNNKQIVGEETDSTLKKHKEERNIFDDLENIFSDSSLNEKENKDNEEVVGKNGSGSMCFEDNLDIKDIRKSFFDLESQSNIFKNIIFDAFNEISSKTLNETFMTTLTSKILEEINIENLIAERLASAIDKLFGDDLKRAIILKLDDVFKDYLGQAVKKIIPEIAEKLIKEEIENIKKGIDE